MFAYVYYLCYFLDFDMRFIDEIDFKIQIFLFLFLNSIEDVLIIIKNIDKQIKFDTF